MYGFLEQLGRTTERMTHTMPSKDRSDVVRRLSNRLFLNISGRRLRAYSIVKHVGRRSGRQYVNPVSVYPLGDGFVITILYGLDSQWVRNVLATGRLTLRTRGRDHALVRPELIPRRRHCPRIPGGSSARSEPPASSAFFGHMKPARAAARMIGSSGRPSRS
jgi:deazaflavin-dependent oxidoreductase (nitroreductase family)